MVFDLFASTAPRTRRWVTAVFAWLGVIVELVAPESVIVDIAIILGLDLNDSTRPFSATI